VTVGGALASTLRDGAAAVVIATRRHRAAFAEQLRREGIDVAGARRSRAYLELDAERTMDAFVVAGTPDRGRFDETIGALVREAGSARQPLFLYGEMVGLLWEAGMVAGAIELERLWNELASEATFTVLCAYRAEDGAEALHHVCGLHSETTRRFPARRASPRAARRFVCDALGAHVLAADAALVVTELATNAVVHAGSGFTVELSVAADAVRVTVLDERCGPPGAAPRAARARPRHRRGARRRMGRRSPGRRHDGVGGAARLTDGGGQPRGRRGHSQASSGATSS
jgi:anti-sigma regulatory factor (Ser/Thr protein kinase)